MPRWSSFGRPSRWWQNLPKFRCGPMSVCNRGGHRVTALAEEVAAETDLDLRVHDKGEAVLGGLPSELPEEEEQR